nr:transglutaminase-like domain-containing protein [uncultured Psychroserpens sp.]
MILKKISWVFKRHPWLYIARFKLLSKNSNIEDIKEQSYNAKNHIKDIPHYFNEVNDIIFKDGKPNNDVDLVKQLSVWLQNNIKGGPGLSEPSDEALKIMLSGKGGVCSDMAQVFNNFCVINNIQVREWGNTRAPFSNDYGGHSFNEFYSNTLNKWILIDVSYSLFFYANNKTEPLSVLEIYDFFPDPNEVYFETFNSSKKIDEKNIIKNYLHPDTVPFLICNYSNKTYDAFLKRTRPHIPVFITHFAIFLVGKSYYYRFPLSDYKKIFN